jgi:hypothetical protein
MSTPVIRRQDMPACRGELRWIWRRCRTRTGEEVCDRRLASERRCRSGRRLARSGLADGGRHRRAGGRRLASEGERTTAGMGGRANDGHVGGARRAGRRRGGRTGTSRRRWILGVGVSGDEDMTPLDTTIDYKVRSFLYLHNNFGYNSLGSICTCHYLNLGTNVSQSASPSKLNFRTSLERP